MKQACNVEKNAMETDSEITQMIKLVGKDIKTTIITLCHIFKKGRGKHMHIKRDTEEDTIKDTNRTSRDKK